MCSARAVRGDRMTGREHAIAPATTPTGKIDEPRWKKADRTRIRPVANIFESIKPETYLGDVEAGRSALDLRSAGGLFMSRIGLWLVPLRDGCAARGDTIIRGNSESDT